jgi:hypothetical protein
MVMLAVEAMTSAEHAARSAPRQSLPIGLSSGLRRNAPG